MNKEHIVSKIWSCEADLSRERVRKIVNRVFEEMGNALLTGDCVRINGFGLFDVKVGQSPKYRDPRTGLPLNKKVARLRFKCSHVLRDQIKAIHEV